jgi:hypothetical protein
MPRILSLVEGRALSASAVSPGREPSRLRTSMSTVLKTVLVIRFSPRPQRLRGEISEILFTTETQSSHGSTSSPRAEFLLAAHPEPSRRTRPRRLSGEFPDSLRHPSPVTRPSSLHQTRVRGLIKSTGEKLGRLNSLKTEFVPSKRRAIQSPYPTRVMIKWTSPLIV